MRSLRGRSDARHRAFHESASLAPPLLLQGCAMRLHAAAPGAAPPLLIPYPGADLDGAPPATLEPGHDARLLLDHLPAALPASSLRQVDTVAGSLPVTPAVQRALQFERYRLLLEAARVGVRQEEHVARCQARLAAVLRDEREREATRGGASSASGGGGSVGGSGGSPGRDCARACVVAAGRWRAGRR